jgi:DNA-binding LytR/AlgR family response regulator
MYKVVIVDDEPGALSVLSKMVNNFFDYEVIGEFSTPDNLIENLARLKPDILFLDIQLGNKSGVDIARDLYYYNSFDIKIVFVSAYDKYAIQAFEYNIIDYILKPVSRDRLQKCMQKIEKSRSNTKEDQSELKSNESSLIRFNTQNGFLLIDPRDIVFMEADHVYTKIVMTKGSNHYVAQNIGKISSIIGTDYFLRISRSNVINVRFLREVNRTQKKCLMSNGSTEFDLTISKTGMKALEEYFG